MNDKAKDGDDESDGDEDEHNAQDILHYEYSEVNLSKYDFVRRYHVFHHLISFFVNDGAVASSPRASTRSNL